MGTKQIPTLDARAIKILDELEEIARWDGNSSLVDLLQFARRQQSLKDLSDALDHMHVLGLVGNYDHSLKTSALWPQGRA